MGLLKQRLILNLVLFSLFVISSPSQADHSRGEMTRYKAEHLVNLLYEAFLFREAEPGGLHFWSDYVMRGGYSALINVVARGIAESDEFQHRVLWDHTSHEVIENAYAVLFYRDVDSLGWRWTSQIDRGDAKGALKGLVSSSEFRRNHID